jgi:hypothetical protein
MKQYAKEDDVFQLAANLAEDLTETYRAVGALLVSCKEGNDRKELQNILGLTN